MKKLKSKIQKLFGYFLSEPLILHNKTIGFSLIKSQRFKCEISGKSRYYPPYYLKNVKIGDYSYVAKNCSITNTSIGKFCSVGPNFCSGLGLHPVTSISTSPMFYSTLKPNGYSLVTENTYEEFRPINIGNDVFIGANVTVLDGVNIGDGAVIGAGAVVTKDIPAYGVAVGVPAKVIKYRFDKDIIDALLELQWWNLPEPELKEIVNNFFDVEHYLDKIKTNREKSRLHSVHKQ